MKPPPADPGLTEGYERLRRLRHARGGPGHAVLRGRGLCGWIEAALAAVQGADTGRSRAAVASPSRPPTSSDRLPVEMDHELTRLLAEMMLERLEECVV